MGSQVRRQAGFLVRAMGSNVTSNLHILILFVWIVSVLTSPVNNDGGTDGASLTSAANSNVRDTLSKKEHQSVPSATRLATEATDSTKTLGENKGSPSLLGEGGPISILSTIQPMLSVPLHLTNVSSNSNGEGNVLERKDVGSNTTAKPSTQSRISPRKGANPYDVDVKQISLSSNITTSHNDKAMNEPSTVSKTTHISEEGKPDGNNDKPDATVKHLSNDSNTSSKLSFQDTNVSQPVSSTTLKPVTTKKHKPKPTVTVGEPGIDKPIPVSPTKSSPFGMPRKIDYIVPVVITIIALPLLGAATFMVYRQGRDCWDKRHYRRMDFLIDGMYND